MNVARSDDQSRLFVRLRAVISIFGPPQAEPDMGAILDEISATLDDHDCECRAQKLGVALRILLPTRNHQNQLQ